MFEHKSQSLLTKHQFAIRMAKVILVTVGIVSTVVGFGTVGFCMTGQSHLVEALHHAVWVAMGHRGDLEGTSESHLLFETVYLLVARLAFFTSAAFVVTPIFHRIMHKLHLDEFN